MPDDAPRPVPGVHAGEPQREGPTGVSNSVVKDEIDKRTMDGQAVVVANKA